MERRYYKAAALWQVGVKLFTGHNGSPCPCSAEALSAVEDVQQIYHLERGHNHFLHDIGSEMGMTSVEVAKCMAEVADLRLGDIPDGQKEVLQQLSDKTDLNILSLIGNVRNRFKQ